MLKVGIQLYSVRRRMKKDPIETIKKVVKAGYKYIETANHNADMDLGLGFGLSLSQAKNLLDRLDAEVISAHISPLDLKRSEYLNRVLEFQREIGVKYVATNLHDFESPDVTMRYVDHLNVLGGVCKKHGIQLLYHNHFLEFKKFENGDCAFDLMMRETGEDLLKIQLDTYWAMRGMEDPIGLMKRYGKRVRVLHQKDYPKGKESDINILAEYDLLHAAAAEKGELVNDYDRDTLTARELDEKALKLFLPIIHEDAFVEIGEGVMPIQDIINAANEHCGSEFIILEQDFTRLDELGSIRVSMNHFKNFDGVVFS